MKFKKVLFIGVFVFAVMSAFASKVSMIDDDVSYYDPYYEMCLNAGVLTVDPSLCNRYYFGPQCTVLAYTPNGVEEFPAFFYDPVLQCQFPLYRQW